VKAALFIGWLLFLCQKVLTHEVKTSENSLKFLLKLGVGVEGLRKSAVAPGVSIGVPIVQIKGRTQNGGSCPTKTWVCAHQK
jgi:hypothetical protein